VDIQDALVAYAQGSGPGNARWNANANLVNGNMIDIQDAALVADYYGTRPNRKSPIFSCSLVNAVFLVEAQSSTPLIGAEL